VPSTPVTIGEVRETAQYDAPQAPVLATRHCQGRRAGELLDVLVGNEAASFHVVDRHLTSLHASQCVGLEFDWESSERSCALL
jgi:hypothetical protein